MGVRLKTGSTTVVNRSFRQVTNIKNSELDEVNGLVGEIKVLSLL
jgi:hypothetical protein